MRYEEKLEGHMGDNSKTIFQLGLDSLGKIAHPRKHSADVDSKNRESQQFLKAFITSLETSAALLGEKAPEELTLLIDESKYSDPVSSEATKDIESKIAALAQDIATFEANSDTTIEDLAGQARKLLAVRNAHLLNSKHR